MALSEAYQQSLLNGAMASLFEEAGDQFRIKLLRNGTELTNPGYGRLTIITLPEAGDIEDDGFVRIRLQTSDSLAPIENELVWNQVELWNSDLTSLVLPRFNSSGTISRGQTRDITLALTCENIENPTTPTPVPTNTIFDFTVGAQLANIAGIRGGVDIPAANPVRTLVSGTYDVTHPLAGQSFDVGTVYSLWKFYQAACNKYSDLDYEEWTFPSTSQGTIGIVNGVVTGNGTNFPVYPINYMTGQLYVGNNIYQVATRTNSTSLILFDTSVNVASGTAYKYARWDHRQQDPSLAFSNADWQQGINEWFYALSLVEDLVVRNDAHPCWYERGVPLVGRYLDIRDSPATWKSQVSTLVNYTSTTGQSYKQYLIDHNSYVLAPVYVANAINNSEAAWTGFITYVENICNTCVELGVPCVPLIKPRTIEDNNNVDLELLEDIVRAIHAITPYQIGVWAFADEVTPEFRVWLSDLIADL